MFAIPELEFKIVRIKNNSEQNIYSISNVAIENWQSIFFLFQVQK